MKIMKKISGIVIALCLLIPCFSVSVIAADGKISFSDPETKVGDVVEVKCAIRSTSGSLGSVEVNVSYDGEYLRFQSGDGVEASGDGALTCSGNGGSNEQIFLMKFQALKEGSTKITISDAATASSTGGTFTMDRGDSTVKIAAGDPSKIVEEGGDDQNVPSAEDMQVEVDGVTYTLTDKFPTGDIPEGYTKTTVSLDGQDRQMVTNENSGVTLGYLLNGNTGSFYLFNEENATFSPYVELKISDTTSIIILSDTSEVSLPEEYQQVELTLDDKSFPVWKKMDEKDYYILYAMNNNGENACYKYDAGENTYQKFEPESSEEEEEGASGLLGKVQKFIQDNIQMIVLVGGLGAIVILLLIIILGVKLYNRNSELDELYEEYGIDEEEDEPEPIKEKRDKKESKFRVGKKKKDSFDEDDFENDFATEYVDFTEDMSYTEDMNFDEEDFATANMDLTEDMNFDGEDFATASMELTKDMSFDEDDFATAQLDGGDGDLLDDIDSDEFVVYGGESRTEELTIDDLDELLGDKPKKAGHSELDDDFKVDFIDLD